MSTYDPWISYKTLYVVNVHKFYQQLQNGTRVTVNAFDPTNKNTSIIFSARANNTVEHYNYRLTNDERRRLLRRLKAVLGK
jgi:hypothetical protein